MNKFVEENKEFLHSIETIPYIIYKHDVRCIQTEEKAILDFRMINWDLNIDGLLSIDSELEPGSEFVYNRTFTPPITPGRGMVAGNLYGIPWTSEMLELLLDQPDIRGIIFESSERMLIYGKSGVIHDVLP